MLRSLRSSSPSRGSIIDLCQFFNNFCQCLTERSELDHDVNVVLRLRFRVTRSKTIMEEEPGNVRRDVHAAP